MPAGPVSNSVESQITNVSELRNFATNIRRVDKDLSRQLSRGLREAVKPVLADARGAVKSIPVHGRNRGNVIVGKRKYGVYVRRAIADSLAIRTSSGTVRIQVNANKLPPGKQAVPRLLEGPKTFRHPLFGNRNRWFQEEAHPWLAPTARKAQPHVQEQIQKLVQDIFNQFENRT